MTQEKARDMVRWFAGCGDRYVRANLAHVDVQRLATDQHYGLKLFFFTWAFERAGAPRAYRIAAVKAVSSLQSAQAKLPELFGTFCRGKHNPNGNPIIDPRIADINVPAIVRLVEQGRLGEAYEKLTLRGIRHKIRAFFLRDLVTLYKVESKLGGDPDLYLWCQPIDVWLRIAANELCGNITITRVPKAFAKYQLDKIDLAAARDIIKLSIDAGVSPLSVNQGIWYFSANAVADEKRLRELIRSGDSKNLDAELTLMEGFLPTRPMWL